MQAGQWCSMQYAEYVDVSASILNSFISRSLIYFLFLHQEEFEINYIKLLSGVSAGRISFKWNGDMVDFCKAPSETPELGEFLVKAKM